MKRKVEYFVAPKDLHNEALITLFLPEAREYHSKVGGSLTKHTSMFFTKQDIEYLKNVYTDPSYINNLVCVFVHTKDFEDDYCLDLNVEKDIKAVQAVLEGDCESIELRFVHFIEEE